MEHQLPESVKAERSRVLLELDKTNSRNFREYYVGKETELLIEVLSFGPMLTVLGNDRFLKSLKQRLERQKKLSDERIALPMKRSGSLSRKNNAE